jgi:hypothetical protein
MDFPHSRHSQPPNDGKNIEFGVGWKCHRRLVGTGGSHLNQQYYDKNRSTTKKTVCTAPQYSRIPSVAVPARASFVEIAGGLPALSRQTGRGSRHGRGSLRRLLMCHGTNHDSKLSPPLPGIPQARLRFTRLHFLTSFMNCTSGNIGPPREREMQTKVRLPRQGYGLSAAKIWFKSHSALPSKGVHTMFPTQFALFSSTSRSRSPNLANWRAIPSFGASDATCLSR